MVTGRRRWTWSSTGRLLTSWRHTASTTRCISWTTTCMALNVPSCSQTARLGQLPLPLTDQMTPITQTYTNTWQSASVVSQHNGSRIRTCMFPLYCLIVCVCFILLLSVLFKVFIFIIFSHVFCDWTQPSILPLCAKTDILSLYIHACKHFVFVLMVFVRYQGVVIVKTVACVQRLIEKPFKWKATGSNERVTLVTD